MAQKLSKYWIVQCILINLDQTISGLFVFNTVQSIHCDIIFANLLAAYGFVICGFLINLANKMNLNSFQPYFNAVLGIERMNRKSDLILLN